MTIDLDVREWAKQWGLDPSLVQAVVNAEGGAHDDQAIVRAVKCSVPSVATRGEALMILCRSLTHRLSDYARGLALEGEDFAAYFGRCWAPQGVANDPTNLNANFAANLRSLWLGTPKAA